jgi:hypothetical protein
MFCGSRRVLKDNGDDMCAYVGLQTPWIKQPERFIE